MFQSSIKNSIVSQVVSSLQICKWHATHDPVKSSLQHEKNYRYNKKSFCRSPQRLSFILLKVQDTMK